VLAVAAFALSASSANAFYNQEFLTRAGLSDQQVVALQEARELRRLGELDAARDTLLEAGIDVPILNNLRFAHRERQLPHRHWLREQITTELTEDEQEALRVARAANDRETVRAILEAAGIDLPPGGPR